MRAKRAIGLVLLTGLLFAGEARAVKYLTLKQAVTKFVPAGDKVVKVKKTLSSEMKRRIEIDYGWTPTQEQVAFYAGKNEQGDRTAYVYIQAEVFNTCFHKFAIGLESNGRVIDTVVVELSCPRAMPMNKRSFLKQFGGKRHSDPLTTSLDVDAITGATLSSEAAAQATRKATSLHHLLFGGGAKIAVSEKTREARKRGAAKIQSAIDNQETVWAGEDKNQ